MKIPITDSRVYERDEDYIHNIMNKRSFVPVFLRRNFRAWKRQQGEDDSGVDEECVNKANFRLLRKKRLVKTVNSELYFKSYQYNKTQALDRARKTHKSVSVRLQSRFRAWHCRWLAGHVSNRQHHTCLLWLMGRGPGARPNITRVVRKSHQGRPPYHPFYRYHVVRPPVPTNPAA